MSFNYLSIILFFSGSTVRSLVNPTSLWLADIAGPFKVAVELNQCITSQMFEQTAKCGGSFSFTMEQDTTCSRSPRMSISRWFHFTRPMPSLNTSSEVTSAPKRGLFFMLIIWLHTWTFVIAVIVNIWTKLSAICNIHTFSRHSSRCWQTRHSPFLSAFLSHPLLILWYVCINLGMDHSLIDKGSKLSLHQNLNS